MTHSPLSPSSPSAQEPVPSPPADASAWPRQVTIATHDGQPLFTVRHTDVADASDAQPFAPGSRPRPALSSAERLSRIAADFVRLRDEWAAVSTARRRHAWGPPPPAPGSDGPWFWQNTLPNTHGRDTWLSVLALRGLAVPRGGTWHDADEWAPPRCPDKGVVERSAEALGERLRHLPSLGAEARELVGLDLMSVLLEEADCTSPAGCPRVLRLDRLGLKGLRRPEEEVAEWDRRLVAQLRWSRERPEPVLPHARRLPLVIAGSARHLATRLGALLLAHSALAARQEQRLGVVEIWERLAALPVGAKAESVAVAAGFTLAMLDEGHAATG